MLDIQGEKVEKHIFILNGVAGAGKDTFAEILDKYIPTYHISSITPVKEVAKVLGWNGKKDAKSRCFLCELKQFLNSQGSYIWDYLDNEIENFRNDEIHQILLIDIREPSEIVKAVKRYNCETILINRESENDKYDNSADKNVLMYKYNYVINNDSDMCDFVDNTRKFAKTIKDKSSAPYFNKIIAVDFDNTIAKTKYPEIIEPIPEVIDLLRELKKKGATIILWTCREGDKLKAAIDWCKEHNVPIDLVNENDKDRTKYWGCDCRKIGADLYIDDKSFSLWHDRRNEQDVINSLFENL